MDIQQNTTQSTPIKFTDDELKELGAIREAYNQITISLGQIQMQKREVDRSEKRVQERLLSVETSEKTFLDKIVGKYGEGEFNVETGLFLPKKK
jgi:hypothetical protein